MRHGGAALALILLGLAPTRYPLHAGRGGRYQAAAAATEAADERVIIRLRSEHDTAAGAGAVESLSAMYTADAVVMPPNQADVVGTAAILSWLKTGCGSGCGASMPFTGAVGNWTDDVRVSGAWASYRATHASGPRVMWILQRQTDGRWKIARSIWNSAR